MRGLRLVELAHPGIVRVLRLFVLSFPHLRVRRFIILIFLVFLVFRRWITITVLWQWNWPLSGERRIILILTLIVASPPV
jgi:hypothetical protein